MDRGTQRVIDLVVSMKKRGSFKPLDEIAEKVERINKLFRKSDKSFVATLTNDFIKLSSVIDEAFSKIERTKKRALGLKEIRNLTDAIRELAKTLGPVPEIMNKMNKVLSSISIENISRQFNDIAKSIEKQFGSVKKVTTSIVELRTSLKAARSSVDEIVMSLNNLQKIPVIKKIKIQADEDFPGMKFRGMPRTGRPTRGTKARFESGESEEIFHKHLNKMFDDQLFKTLENLKYISSKIRKRKGKLPEISVDELNNIIKQVDTGIKERLSKWKELPAAVKGLFKKGEGEGRKNAIIGKVIGELKNWRRIIDVQTSSMIGDATTDSTVDLNRILKLKKASRSAGKIKDVEKEILRMQNQVRTFFDDSLQTALNIQFGGQFEKDIGGKLKKAMFMSALAGKKVEYTFKQIPGISRAADKLRREFFKEKVVAAQEYVEEGLNRLTKVVEMGGKTGTMGRKVVAQVDFPELEKTRKVLAESVQLGRKYGVTPELKTTRYKELGETEKSYATRVARLNVILEEEKKAIEGSVEEKERAIQVAAKSTRIRRTKIPKKLEEGLYGDFIHGPTKEIDALKIASSANYEILALANKETHERLTTQIAKNVKKTLLEAAERAGKKTFKRQEAWNLLESELGKYGTEKEFLKIAKKHVKGLPTVDKYRPVVEEFLEGKIKPALEQAVKRNERVTSLVSTLYSILSRIGMGTTTVQSVERDELAFNKGTVAEGKAYKHEPIKSTEMKFREALKRLSFRILDTSVSRMDRPEAFLPDEGAVYLDSMLMKKYGEGRTIGHVGGHIMYDQKLTGEGGMKFFAKYFDSIRKVGEKYSKIIEGGTDEGKLASAVKEFTGKGTGPYDVRGMLNVLRMMKKASSEVWKQVEEQYGKEYVQANREKIANNLAKTGAVQTEFMASMFENLAVMGHKKWKSTYGPMNEMFMNAFGPKNAELILKKIASLGPEGLMPGNIFAEIGNTRKKANELTTKKGQEALKKLVNEYGGFLPEYLIDEINEFRTRLAGYKSKSSKAAKGQAVKIPGSSKTHKDFFTLLDRVKAASAPAGFGGVKMFPFVGQEDVFEEYETASGDLAKADSKIMETIKQSSLRVTKPKTKTIDAARKMVKDFGLSLSGIHEILMAINKMGAESGLKIDERLFRNVIAKAGGFSGSPIEYTRSKRVAEQLREYGVLSETRPKETEIFGKDAGKILPNLLEATRPKLKPVSTEIMSVAMKAIGDFISGQAKDVVAISKTELFKLLRKTQFAGRGALDISEIGDITGQLEKEGLLRPFLASSKQRQGGYSAYDISAGRSVSWQEGARKYSDKAAKEEVAAFTGRIPEMSESVLENFIQIQAAFSKILGGLAKRSLSPAPVFREEDFGVMLDSMIKKGEFDSLFPKIEDKVQRRKGVSDLIAQNMRGFWGKIEGAGVLGERAKVERVGKEVDVRTLKLDKIKELEKGVKGDLDLAFKEHEKFGKTSQRAISEQAEANGKLAASSGEVVAGVTNESASFSQLSQDIDKTSMSVQRYIITYSGMLKKARESHGGYGGGIPDDSGGGGGGRGKDRKLVPYGLLAETIREGQMQQMFGGGAFEGVRKVTDTYTGQFSELIKQFSSLSIRPITGEIFGVSDKKINSMVVQVEKLRERMQLFGSDRRQAVKATYEEFDGLTANIGRLTKKQEEYKRRLFGEEDPTGDLKKKSDELEKRIKYLKTIREHLGGSLIEQTHEWGGGRITPPSLNRLMRDPKKWKEELSKRMPLEETEYAEMVNSMKTLNQEFTGMLLPAMEKSLSSQLSKEEMIFNVKKSRVVATYELLAEYQELVVLEEILKKSGQESLSILEAKVAWLDKVAKMEAKGQILPGRPEVAIRRKEIEEDQARLKSGKDMNRVAADLNILLKEGVGSVARQDELFVRSVKNFREMRDLGMKPAYAAEKVLSVAQDHYNVIEKTANALTDFREERLAGVPGKEAEDMRKAADERIASLERERNAANDNINVAREQMMHYRQATDKAKSFWRTTTEGFGDLVVSQAAWIMGFGAIFGLIYKIRASFKGVFDIENALARPLKTVEGTMMSATEVAQRFRRVVTDSLMTFATDVKTSAEILYQFGSAGLKAEESLAAFNSTLKLVLGTEAEVGATTKLVAGIYNNYRNNIIEYEDEILGIIESEKSLINIRKNSAQQVKEFARINDILAYTFKVHQVEMNELEEGLRYFIATGRIAGLTLDQMATMIGFLNDRMIRGSKAGRGLQLVFQSIVKDSSKFASAFNIEVPMDKPIDFINILEQLNKKINSGVLTASEMAAIFSTMEIRGSQPFIKLVQDFEILKQQMSETKFQSKGMADQLAQIELSKPERQFKMFGETVNKFLRETVEPFARAGLGIIKLTNWMSGATAKNRQLMNESLAGAGGRDKKWYEQVEEAGKTVAWTTLKVVALSVAFGGLVSFLGKRGMFQEGKILAPFGALGEAITSTRLVKKADEWAKNASRATETFKMQLYGLPDAFKGFDKISETVTVRFRDRMKLMALSAKAAMVSILASPMVWFMVALMAVDWIIGKIREIGAETETLKGKLEDSIQQTVDISSRVDELKMKQAQFLAYSGEGNVDERNQVLKDLEKNFSDLSYAITIYKDDNEMLNKSISDSIELEKARLALAELEVSSKMEKVLNPSYLKQVYELLPGKIDPLVKQDEFLKRFVEMSESHAKEIGVSGEEIREAMRTYKSGQIAVGNIIYEHEKALEKGVSHKTTPLAAFKEDTQEMVRYYIEASNHLKYVMKKESESRRYGLIEYADEWAKRRAEIEKVVRLPILFEDKEKEVGGLASSFNALKQAILGAENSVREFYYKHGLIKIFDSDEIVAARKEIEGLIVDRKKYSTTDLNLMAKTDKEITDKNKSLNKKIAEAYRGTLESSVEFRAKVFGWKRIPLADVLEQQLPQIVEFRKKIEEEAMKLTKIAKFGEAIRAPMPWSESYMMAMKTVFDAVKTEAEVTSDRMALETAYATGRMIMSLREYENDAATVYKNIESFAAELSKAVFEMANADDSTKLQAQKRVLDSYVNLYRSTKETLIKLEKERTEKSEELERFRIDKMKLTNRMWRGENYREMLKIFELSYKKNMESLGKESGISKAKLELWKKMYSDLGIVVDLAYKDIDRHIDKHSKKMDVFKGLRDSIKSIQDRKMNEVETFFDRFYTGGEQMGNSLGTLRQKTAEFMGWTKNEWYRTPENVKGLAAMMAGEFEKGGDAAERFHSIFSDIPKSVRDYIVSMMIAAKSTHDLQVAIDGLATKKVDSMWSAYEKLVSSGDVKSLEKANEIFMKIISDLPSLTGVTAEKYINKTLGELDSARFKNMMEKPYEDLASIDKIMDDLNTKVKTYSEAMVVVGNIIENAMNKAAIGIDETTKSLDNFLKKMEPWYKMFGEKFGIKETSFTDQVKRMTETMDKLKDADYPTQADMKIDKETGKWPYLEKMLKLIELFGGNNVEVSKRMKELEKKAPERAGAIGGEVPESFAPFLAAASKQYGVSENLLKAVMRIESGGTGYDVRALSNKGAMGIMQVLPGTAKDLGYTPEEMFDPEKAITAAAKYLSQIKGAYLGNIENVAELARGYHAGPETLTRSLNIAKEPLTTDYIQKVVAEVARLGGVGKPKDEAVPQIATTLSSLDLTMIYLNSSITKLNDFLDKSGGKNSANGISRILGFDETTIIPQAAKASGGFISGPGGPKDDKIPTLLSNGEFVVNAEATRKNREMLEKINMNMYSQGGGCGLDNSCSTGLGKEMKFREWYAEWAKKLGLASDPYDEKHYYDYRKAYEEGAYPTWQKEHNEFRWPDKYKLQDHPNMDNKYAEGGYIVPHYKKLVKKIPTRVDRLDRPDFSFHKPKELHEYTADELLRRDDIFLSNVREEFQRKAVEEWEGGGLSDPDLLSELLNPLNWLSVMSGKLAGTIGGKGAKALRHAPSRAKTAFDNNPWSVKKQANLANTDEIGGGDNYQFLMKEIDKLTDIPEKEYVVKYFGMMKYRARKLMDEFGDFIDIPRFAEGGTVTGPTIGLLGERGPESVIPGNVIEELQKANAYLEIISKNTDRAWTEEDETNYFSPKNNQYTVNPQVYEHKISGHLDVSGSNIELGEETKEDISRRVKNKVTNSIKPGAI